jgi:hypothetical protein
MANEKKETTEQKCKSDPQWAADKIRDLDYAVSVRDSKWVHVMDTHDQALRRCQQVEKELEKFDGVCAERDALREACGDLKEMEEYLRSMAFGMGPPYSKGFNARAEKVAAIVALLPEGELRGEKGGEADEDEKAKAAHHALTGE